jgi:glycosyltransferase involved in cell wall biosynthesis
MKIMIDTRSVDARQSGVGKYVTHLIRGLEAVGRKNHYVLMVTTRQLRDFPNFFSKFDVYTVPFSSENHFLGDPWEFFLLPNALRREKIDLFHGPAFMAPPFHKHFKSVATIHDLVAFHHPHTIPTKYAFYMRYLIKLMIRKADGIITDSEFIRHEIIKMFRIKEEIIFTVPISVSDLFKPVGDADRIENLKKRYGIQKRYFLHVGNIEPRKNLINLFRACDLVWQKLGRDFQLVVVGKKGWLYSDIFETLKDAAFARDVVFTGYVEDKDIPALYSGADFFVFPSLYEGFGLPILEAMRCGVPVIASHVASLPEVAGDAALYVDPKDPKDIAEKLLTLADDFSLQESLRQKGFLQAAKFSWERTARKTLDVYEAMG